MDEETAQVSVLYGSTESEAAGDMPQRRLSASALYDAAFRLSGRHCGAFDNQSERWLREHRGPFSAVILCGSRRLVDLGKFIGLSDPNAAYWVRFLNIPLYVG